MYHKLLAFHSQAVGEMSQRIITHKAYLLFEYSAVLRLWLWTASASRGPRGVDSRDGHCEDAGRVAPRTGADRRGDHNAGTTGSRTRAAEGQASSLDVSDQKAGPSFREVRTSRRKASNLFW